MLNITQMTNIPVLKPQGRFEAYTIAPVRNWLDENQSAANIVVDLSGVTFLDSTALATLVQGMKHCRKLNGNLHLAGLQPSVKLIIELTRLDKAFGIYPDVATAVSALSPVHH
ncbi:MAG: STAS domain-containing protein [Chloroflexota bacterium]